MMVSSLSSICIYWFHDCWCCNLQEKDCLREQKYLKSVQQLSVLFFLIFSRLQKLEISSCGFASSQGVNSGFWVTWLLKCIQSLSWWFLQIYTVFTVIMKIEEFTYCLAIIQYTDMSFQSAVLQCVYLNTPKSSRIFATGFLNVSTKKIIALFNQTCKLIFGKHHCNQIIIFCTCLHHLDAIFLSLPQTSEGKICHLDLFSCLSHLHTVQICLSPSR